jgi:hypothetical protein
VTTTNYLPAHLLKKQKEKQKSKTD